ncbi:MAG TPA: hypothetical protein VGJ07_17945 [Rugosimonospora sp.]|jgi:hypothetical protein
MWCRKEAAHIACGHLDTDGGYAHRGLADVEAESVAYLLCTAAGMNVGAAPFDYIGTWAGGDRTLIHRSAGTVIRTAQQLMLRLHLDPTPAA